MSIRLKLIESLRWVTSIRRERRLRALAAEALAFMAVRAEGHEGIDAALAEWLLRSPDHVQVWFELTAFYEEAGEALGCQPLRPVISTVESASIHEPRAYLGRSPPARRAGTFKYPLLAAAMLAGLVVGGLWTHQLSANALEYATPIGQHRIVELEDGTTVHLNTDSRIAVRFTRATRIVELIDGEALFDIAHDDRPFHVHSGALTIEDIGTRFTARLDPTGLSVAVIEGRVRILPRRHSKDSQRSPWPATPEVSAGTEITVSTQAETLPMRLRAIPDDVQERQLTWTRGYLTFLGESVGTAVAEFNRYNVRQLEIADPTIAGLAVGGQFNATDPEAFAIGLSPLGIYMLPPVPGESATAPIRLTGTPR